MLTAGTKDQGLGSRAHKINTVVKSQRVALCLSLLGFNSVFWRGRKKQRHQKSV